jgi:hypothetical protein
MTYWVNYLPYRFELRTTEPQRCRRQQTLGCGEGSGEDTSPEMRLGDE